MAELKHSLPDLMKLPHEFYIDGKFTPPPSDAQTFDIVDPASEQVITKVPIASAADVDAAVKAARNAFDEGSWPKSSGKERGAYLRAIAKKVMEQRSRLATLESWNCGKPWKEAEWDMGDVAGAFEYFASLAELQDQKAPTVVELPDADYEGRVVYEPLGVVGAIVPWNYPLLMATWKIAPALAAGCTIVIKPSEFTPLTLLELARIAAEVPLPAGVLNVLTGDGPTTGEALSSHPGIDKLAFTGSVPTGSRIMANAAKDVRRVTLELGGKSAAIVFDDVDIDKAVEWVMFGCFWTNGQICSATSRLLVQESIADKFINRLVECTKRIPIGAPLSPGLRDKTGTIGPLVCRKQYENVMRHITNAVKDGAEVLAGGKRPEEHKTGFFVEPTILRVNSKARVWHEEVFGPVLSVVAFKDEQDAVKMANDSEYGLGGAVFSKDLKRCERVVRALRVGVTWINCSQPTFTQLPWGGVKKSGFGRDLGEIGFQSYLEPKQIVTFKAAAEKGTNWYDMSAPAAKL